MTVGSFNVTATSGTYSIRNNTTGSTDSTLTLGGAGNLGNSISGNAADLLYVVSGGTFNIIGPNGSSGTGILKLVLGQDGNFNIVGSSTISAGISGAYGFAKTGGGTLALSASNSYSGTTTVSNGVLQVADVNALKNSTLDTGASGAQSVSFTVSGDNTYNLGGLAGSDALSFGANSLSVGANNSNTTFAGDLSATSGGLTKVGLGTLTFSGVFAATNLAVTSGEFALGAADRITDTANVTVSGGRFSTAYDDTVGTFSISGTAELSGAGTLTATTYTLGGGTVSGNLGAGTATASSGTTAFSGTLAGNLTVNGGTVNLGSSDRIGNSSSVTVSSGALNLGGNDTVGAVQVTGGTLGGSGALAGASYDVQGGTISAALAGSGAMTKSGAGTVTLSGANSAYSGAVTVGGGTLRADANNALGTGSVTVTNGSVVAASGVSVANAITIGTVAFTSTNFGSTTVLAGWDVNGLAAGARTVAGSGAAEVLVGNIALGSGVGGSGITGALGGNNWDDADVSGAVASGAYMTFNVTPTSGATVLRFTTLNPFYYRSSATGPTNATLQYSLDGGTTYSDLFTTNGYTRDTTTGSYGSMDLSSGGTTLQAVGTNGVVFRWANYGASSSAGTWYVRDVAGNDLVVNGQVGTISNTAASGTGTLGIDEAGSATFSGNVTVNNTATLTAAAGGSAVFSGAIGGAGSLTKTGAGTVTFSGASANTFTNALTINEGTLELAKTAGVTALAGNATVNSGATLLVSAGNQVANTAAITLSGGTISRGSGVSEVFGDLNITQASMLEFGSGTAGTMEFGTYDNNNETPSALLTLNNFFPGNKFIFSSTSFTATNVGSYFAFTGNFTAYSIGNTGSTFTITAIPEPSTCLAAAVLAGLLLWPLRRHVFRKGGCNEIN